MTIYVVNNITNQYVGYQERHIETYVNWNVTQQTNLTITEDVENENVQNITIQYVDKITKHIKMNVNWTKIE